MCCILCLISKKRLELEENLITSQRTTGPNKCIRVSSTVSKLVRTYLLMQLLVVALEQQQQCAG